MKSKETAAALYSGFSNWDTFMAVYKYLDPGDREQNISYWGSLDADISADPSTVETEEPLAKTVRTRPLKLEDEFLIVMCRLRLGSHADHLYHLFDVSTSTVSKILITWINFMYLKFGHINIWPSRKVVERTVPEAFKSKYKSTRIIIDCTEIRCQMPSSLQLNGKLFSNYKNHTTFKGLVDISPGGAITFVSQLHRGSISDWANCQGK